MNNATEHYRSVGLSMICPTVYGKKICAVVCMLKICLENSFHFIYRKTNYFFRKVVAGYD